MSRVVIVGAGVIGLAAAYALRRRSHEVIVVDRDEPGIGCSRSNAGWICPSLSAPLPSPDLGLASLASTLHPNSPLHIDVRAMPQLAPWLWRFWRNCNARDFSRGVDALAALNAHTMQAFDAWAADGINFEMHRAGMLWAFRDPRHIERSARDVAALAALGYRAPAPMDGRQLRALEPDLGEAVTGGFVVEGERHVRPESLIQGLVQRLPELGVELRSGVTVLGGPASSGILNGLNASNGDVRGDLFVLAAGAWSGRLAASLGTPLPVQAGKGYSITVPAAMPSLRRALYLPEAKVAVSPFDGALRIAGTMELSGLNTRLDHRRIHALQRSAERYFTAAPDWSRGERWVGARPITPDGLPLIGRLPGFRNVFVATGHGMLGVTLAPATAEFLAELMDPNYSASAPNPFDPAR